MARDATTGFVGFVSFEDIAFHYFAGEDGADFVAGRTSVGREAAEFAADGIDYGIGEEESADAKTAKGLLLLVELAEDGFNPALFAGEENPFEVLLGLGIEVEKIVFEDEFVIDGFSKDDSVDAPVYGVGEDDPLDALVRGIVDGLLDVGVLQFRADGFNLDQLLKFAIDLGGEVAVGAADGVLGSDVGVFVVAVDLAKHVFDDRDGVGLADVAGFGGGEDGLEAFNRGD